MAGIVLAFAPADAAAGAAVEEALAAAGFDVETDAPPSARSWLAKRAARSQAVVVLWSRHASVSPGVLRQAAQARQAGKLIAARLDKAAVAPVTRGATAIDLAAHDGLDALLARLTAVSASPAPIPPAASAPAKPAPMRAADPLPSAASAAASTPRKGVSVMLIVAGAIGLMAALAAGLLLL